MPFRRGVSVSGGAKIGIFSFWAKERRGKNQRKRAAFALSGASKAGIIYYTPVSGTLVALYRLFSPNQDMTILSISAAGVNLLSAPAVYDHASPQAFTARPSCCRPFFIPPGSHPPSFVTNLFCYETLSYHITDCHLHPVGGTDQLRHLSFFIPAGPARLRAALPGRRDHLGLYRGHGLYPGGTILPDQPVRQDHRLYPGGNAHHLYTDDTPAQL